MNEDLDFIIDSTQEAMQNALVHLEKQLVNIRAGKANPAMLGNVRVDYYGNLTPLHQVANVNTPDARTLSIQPFEKSMIGAIQKGIMEANLGFNPMDNGENVIINVPALTEERRRDLAKQAKSEAEDSKIGVRNDRKNANQEIKKLDISDDAQKDAEAEIQKLTDFHVEKIEKILAAKEKEIMTV